MNKDELKAAVDAYFEAHLDRKYWVGLDADTQTAAVTMALSDIQAIHKFTLASLADPESILVKAIAEQAVYLVRNHEEQTEGKVTIGESAEGVSNTFALIGTPGLSHRAAAFISQAKAAFLRPGLHIRRG